MFDLNLKKSSSLSCSRETDEFRRVAVRRKAKGAVVECQASQTGHTKPAHYQAPLRAGRERSHSPAIGTLLSHQASGTEEDHSPNGDYGVSVPCVIPAQNCLSSLSPVRGDGISFSNGVSGAHISPARCSFLVSPSPGKRGFQDCSPLREGGHNSGKLCPGNHTSVTGKLHTPSPVQGRMCSYTPVKNSKSWLRLHRISSSKMKGQERRARKSLSVPDLIVHLDENRIPTEQVECSSLKPLPSPHCSQPDITIKTPTSRSPTANEAFLSIGGKIYSPGNLNTIEQGTDCEVVQGKGMNDRMEDGNIHIGYRSMFSCHWNRGSADDGHIHNEPGNEINEERKVIGESETKDEESTEQKLYKIANELLQTERAYVARLHLLDQVFCSRLTEEAGRGSFPPDVIRNIFSNVSSIYCFHSQFLLPDLETCLNHWYESPGLGSVLLRHTPFLRMYADYIGNFEQAIALVRAWTERSSAFRNLIRDIERQGVCGSLSLQHHMLEPVQRVPRYEMLLRDYLKKLPEDNPDYLHARKSLQNILLAATHSNSAIRKAEKLRRLLEIYEMVGDQEVINPTNVFLREGRLLKLAARNTSAMERHLFLFNNFLLCCTPKFSLIGQRFTVRCRIGVDGMQVQQTTNEEHLYTFQVSGKEKTLELQTSSTQDRDEWIQVIQGAIDEFQKKNETFKLASKELDVDDPAEELGRRAPRWIRDNEVTMCMKCQEPFNTFTRRRHHCRACGFVVCGKCSDNKVALEYDGNKLNKVCKSCYSILTGQRGDRLEDKRETLELEASPVSNDRVMSGFHQVVTTLNLAMNAVRQRE